MYIRVTVTAMKDGLYPIGTKTMEQSFDPNLQSSEALVRSMFSLLIAEWSDVEYFDVDTAYGFRMERQRVMSSDDLTFNQR